MLPPAWFGLNSNYNVELYFAASFDANPHFFDTVFF